MARILLVCRRPAAAAGASGDHPVRLRARPTIRPSLTLTDPITVTQEPKPPQRQCRVLATRQPEPTPIAHALQALAAGMVLSALAVPTTVSAQTVGTAAEGGVGLKGSGMLREELPQEARRQTPSFVFGDEIEGQNDGKITIRGRAELRRHDTSIRADLIEHDQSTGDSKAEGGVRIRREGDLFEGPYLELNTITDKGYFDQPEYVLLENEGKGDATRVDFIDKDHYAVHNGRYSTCPRPPGQRWEPDWLVRGKRIDLDQVEKVGTAYTGVLEFKGVPILAAPILSFPLSDERKSGFLPPSAGVDSTNGFEVKAPYYFNLAPNYDLTLTPTLMAKRGVELEGLFRYLQPSYTGAAKLALMPSDRLRDETRWFYSHQHVQGLSTPIGGIRLNLNLNHVSDDAYWKDFDRFNSESRWSRLLPSSASLSWSRGHWGVGVGAATYQTLQDPASFITPPYDQLPFVKLGYGRGDLELFGLSDWEFQFGSAGARFRRSFTNPAGTRVVNEGDRLVGVTTLTRRWQAPGWFLQPTARLHVAQYRFDNSAGTQQTRSRAIPTLSVDSGLIFERDASMFGRGFTQTLEPRAFFTYTPFRDQSALPNFDSAALDFNMMSMFYDDIYSGNDRVADLKAMALGLSSRLIDDRDGAEIVRVGLAQRYYFDDIEVTLPGRSVIPKGLSDMLLAARVQWTRDWSLDTNIQFNHETRESSRKTIGMRYTPGDYRVLSLAYRVQRNVSEQVDIGWQWPLSNLLGSLPERVNGKAFGPGQWYSVGRVNYGVTDKKPLEIIAGFEYDAGCWLGRVVLERRQTSSTTDNKRIMFQLEFPGFASLGGSALQTLGASIPRYKALRDGEIVPSRFENYD